MAVLSLSLIQVDIINNEISILAEVWHEVVNWVTLWLLEGGGEFGANSLLSIT